jgi:nucleotide-binding universal stress UspA family protein
MRIRPTPKRGRVLVEMNPGDEPLLSRSAEVAARPAPFALRRILVPIDFSACSRKALAYAVPLARQFQSVLLLVYVVPVQYFVGSEFGPVEVPLPEARVRHSSERELRRLAQEAIGGAVPVEIQVGRGQPVHEIVRVARERQVDLILLSTHGHTGLKHVLLGSVAENVVRYAPCPVLVVRQQEHEFLAASAGGAAVPRS